MGSLFDYYSKRVRGIKDKASKAVDKIAASAIPGSELLLEVKKELTPGKKKRKSSGRPKGAKDKKKRFKATTKTSKKKK